ncbi:hypothetical protein BJX99DRAFT_252620 [Aspergillus californicus]
MDPITAFSIAAGVIAFVDLTMTITKIAWEIHTSPTGGTAVNQDAYEMAERFQTAASDLQKLQLQKNVNTDWIGLITKCKEASKGLRDVLDKLKVKKTDSKIKKGWVVFRTVCKEEEVKEWKKRIGECRDELHFLISKDAMIQNDERFKALISLASSSRKELSAMQKAVDALTLATKSQTLLPDTVTKLQEMLSKMIDATERARQSRVLMGLSFPEILNRYREIGPPHEGSLDWLLNDTGPVADCGKTYNKRIEKARERFVGWLRHGEEGEGLFQICGKIGCGKSAALKYISGHPQTKAYLTEWAQTSDNRIALAIGRVFLMRTGTRLQSSRSGLIRSVLHSISTDAPDLIPLLFPEEWAASASDPDIMFHDEGRLNLAFKALKDYDGHKMVIFVDGLDEINHDLSSMVSELRTWVESNPNVKICVSNREVPMVQNRLEKFPSLQLHTVNQGGIAKFVRDTLAKEADLFDEDEGELKIELLIQHMIENSAGVFLWVSLILQDLVLGLNNANSLETLSNKIYALPGELNKLFGHILSSMHTCDKKQAYTFLSLALASHGPCPLLRFSFLPAYTVNDKFADSVLPQLSPDEIQRRLCKVQRQISGVCGGLLEVVQDVSQRQLTFQSHVKFTHDSIAGFLTSDPVFRGMAKKWEEFNPVGALWETFRAHIKSAGLALTGYTSATIWEISDGVPSFEFDVHHLLEVTCSQSLPFNFSASLNKAVDEICAIHPDEETRCFTQWARYPPKLKLREMVMLMAGLRGYKDSIPGLSQERAQICVAALCETIKTPQLGTVSQVLGLLESFFNQSKACPNGPYPLQPHFLGGPEQSFSYWHCALISALRAHVFKLPSAGFLDCVAFFIYMGADLRVSVSVTAFGRDTVAVHLHQDRCKMRILEMNQLIPIQLLPPQFPTSGELSFEALVKVFFPLQYRSLKEAIEWVLRRDGPPTAEDRQELERLFGKPLCKIWREPKTQS